jgi:hypothetical protein
MGTLAEQRHLPVGTGTRTVRRSPAQRAGPLSWSVLGNRFGWRLPTLAELTSLLDPTQTPIGLPAGHPFLSIAQSTPQNGFQGKYWTSTQYRNSFSSDAWYIVEVSPGAFFEFTSSGQGTNFAWCVRGGSGPDDGSQQGVPFRRVSLRGIAAEHDLIGAVGPMTCASTRW